MLRAAKPNGWASVRWCQYDFLDQQGGASACMVKGPFLLPVRTVMWGQACSVIANFSVSPLLLAHDVLSNVPPVPYHFLAVHHTERLRWRHLVTCMVSHDVTRRQSSPSFLAVPTVSLIPDPWLLIPDPWHSRLLVLSSVCAFVNYF